MVIISALINCHLPFLVPDHPASNGLDLPGCRIGLLPSFRMVPKTLIDHQLLHCVRVTLAQRDAFLLGEGTTHLNNLFLQLVVCGEGDFFS